jgi:hypothetical protein
MGQFTSLGDVEVTTYINVKRASGEEVYYIVSMDSNNNPINIQISKEEYDGLVGEVDG